MLNSNPAEAFSLRIDTHCQIVWGTRWRKEISKIAGAVSLRQPSD